MSYFSSILESARPSIRSAEWNELRVVAENWQPPNTHVMPISNALSAVCGILWATSYILLTIRAFKDRSYGMPIFALCLNVTWELIYSFIYPPDIFNAVFFALEAIVDVVLFVATARYGKHEWKDSPLIANHLPSIVVICAFLCAWMQLALASELIPVIGRQVVFFTSWPLQIVLGAGSIAQIMTRDSTRGHSIHIWWTRAVGTFCAACCFQYRVAYWPERFGYAGKPVAIFILVVSTCLDIAYLFIFRAVKERERLARRSPAPKVGKSE
ncbi:hypothetical protein QM012_000759 [Aureobasidium pullulans]|uniref:PQ loop repeat protein n=1 Tax=Aureobasidium pullulans TaxID=5580 RepID=A0ABR0TXS0_AURPU